jgi:hypothetical protein
MKRYTLAELQALPTLESGHFDNLKIDEKVGSSHARVWLSRLTVADGMPYNNQVTVEERVGSGNWETVDTYQAR